MRVIARPFIVVALVALLAPMLRAQAPADIADRAEADFSAGRIAESVAGYDRLRALVPSVAPVLWQRGIGLYYLGRYDECAAQFAADFAVNPTDLENATWHFLCVSRAQSPERARAALLNAGPDRRVMRTEIYEMLRGRTTPAELVAEAEKSYPIVQFYAHLYVGLYLEALGDRPGSLEQIRLAASDEYRVLGGFMSTVAQVHLKMRTAR